MNYEDKILEYITADYTWEQIIYDIVAWEGLDPWNVDICALSEGFLNYMNSVSKFDFLVPSKYVVVASTLLRMKSNYIKYVQEEIDKAQNAEAELIEEEINNALAEGEGDILHVASIEVPPRRRPTRKIVLNELVSSLKKALDAHARKEGRISNLKKRINVKSDEISSRIAILYDRINEILGRMESPEMQFSDLVTSWDRDTVVNTFIPVIYLDNQKKIEAIQKEMFDDILIRKRPKKTPPKKPVRKKGAAVKKKAAS